MKNKILATITASAMLISGFSISTSSFTANAATTSSFKISTFSDMKGKVDDDVYEAFETLEFEFKINPSISTTGVFSVPNHSLTLKTGNGYYCLHELGHFVSYLEKNADGTSEWKSIYNEEKSKYTASNKNYVTATPSEYFAESFKDYTSTPTQLKAQRPKTYYYINTVVNNIDIDKDCAWFECVYGMFW